jgi:hypothetical protein
MIFGVAIRPEVLMVLGVTAFTLLVFQILLGYRKIKFKGKTHLRVHKRVAWALLTVASVHGFLAFVYGSGLRIG